MLMDDGLKCKILFEDASVFAVFVTGLMCEAMLGMGRLE